MSSRMGVSIFPFVDEAEHPIDGAGMIWKETHLGDDSQPVFGSLKE